MKNNSSVSKLNYPASAVTHMRLYFIVNSISILVVYTVDCSHPTIRTFGGNFLCVLLLQENVL